MHARQRLQLHHDVELTMAVSLSLGAACTMNRHWKDALIAYGKLKRKASPQVIL